MTVQDIQAPYPLIEFDAYKAARIYSAFAQALQTNKTGILLAMESQRAKAISEAPVKTRLQPIHDPARSLRWAINVCIGKAEPLAASLGRAWLPERTVLTLLRMDSGQALDTLMQYGNLHQAIGVDRPKM